MTDGMKITNRQFLRIRRELVLTNSVNCTHIKNRQK